MENEFPGVIDLNVGGTFYRTLLSTLTKDSDSKLAAMFSGQLPVYKDKDDRYFIEGNGSTFQAILHYLNNGELPTQSLSQRTGFGFGGATRHGLFGDYQRGVSYTSGDIEMLYRDALNLGLTKFARELEQFQPIFINTKMDEYRKSLRGYDECLAKVVGAIPSEALFHTNDFTVRIKQDFQTIGEEKCCEHECRIAPPLRFGEQYRPTVDAEVKVSHEVDPNVLSALSIDLRKRGFVVYGRVATCNFICKKEPKQSKYVSFFKQVSNCCTEELFLLTFRLEFESHVQHSSNGFIFGRPQPENVFSFATSAGGFGSTRPQQPVFSSPAFGEQHQQGSFKFGGQQQQQDKSSAFSFSPQQQQQQQQQNSSTFSFNPQSLQTQVEGSLFGGQQKTGGFVQATGGFSFGSPQKQSSGFFGQQQQKPQQPFGQSSQQTGFSFGTTALVQPLTKPQGAQPGFGQGLFGSAVSTTQQPLFGMPQTNSLFGGTQTNSLFGGTQPAVTKQQQHQQTTSEFTFGTSTQSQTPRAIASPIKKALLGVQKQQVTTAFSGKPALSGQTHQETTLFGGKQASAGHVFGGSPSLEQKIGVSIQSLSISDTSSETEG